MGGGPPTLGPSGFDDLVTFFSAFVSQVSQCRSPKRRFVVDLRCLLFIQLDSIENSVKLMHY